MRKKISRVFRFAWAFYFFLCFLVFFLLFYPLFLFFLASEKRYPYAHKLRGIWGKIIMWLSGLRPSTEYEVELDKNKTYIFFANHFSYLDILSLNVQIPVYFRFLAKSELASIPLFKIFFRTIDIPVERNNIKGAFASFESARIAASAGDSLGIFPEGGIGTTVPVMRRFKTGAFRLAMENNIQLIPVTIVDNWKRLPGGGFESGGTPGKMRIYVHKPIEPADFDSLEELTKHAYLVIQEKFNTLNF